MNKAQELIAEMAEGKNFPPPDAQELTPKEANLMAIKGDIDRYGDKDGWRYYQSSTDKKKFFKIKL